MKQRTLSIAGNCTKLAGFLFGGGLIILAAAETINAVLCCLASERQE